jgi:hypothetical protein
MLRLLVAVTSAITVALPMAASGTPGQPRLNGKLSARSISLTDAQGRQVRSLRQNSYRLVVKDSSKAQNFHLVGPGVDVRTKLAATGTRAWDVYLRPGTYVYRSDGNAKLRGSFRVEPGPPPA